jgi:glycosyltransferase involved in cell wall biosynthesis
MKVLQTIGGFGAKGGGTSTCTYDLLISMHQSVSGADVDLLTPSVTDPSDRIMSNGEQWIKVVDNDYRTPLSISKNMVDFLQQSNYDVYHTNGMWMHINHITCSVARSKNKPYVITPHGMLYPEALARSAWKKWPLRKLWFDRDIREAGCIHATCQDEMKHLRTLGYKGPIALIGNPVCVPLCTSEFIGYRNHKPDGLIKLGFLGRLHPRKHVEKILQGVALIQDKNIEIYIMGKGDDSYEEFLHNEVLRLGLGDRVHFLGFLNGREKFEQLSKITALFVPSDIENFGMIIPEALIVGTPVMASLGTPWEALNIENCGWWKDNSPESIAEVIEEIKDLSPDQLYAMGARGREYILKNFAADRVATQMYSLYQWLNGDSDKPDFVYE